MCESRHSRLKIKGRTYVRARVARRNERIDRRERSTILDSATPPPTRPHTFTNSNLNPSTTTAPSSPRNTSAPPSVRVANQSCVTKPRVNRELLAIALRTVELMRTNRELQIRMANLRRETTEFIIDVMNNPENAVAKARMIAAQKHLASQGKPTSYKSSEEKGSKACERPQID